jgi:hypothetical protein
MNSPRPGRPTTMSDRQPNDTTNLDIYGDPPLPWSRAHEALAVGAHSLTTTFFLGTVRPDGRPHAAGIGVAWHEVDGDALTAPYSAPSAGPPPWHVYRFAFHTVFGVATREPHGATRWRF